MFPYGYTYPNSYEEPIVWLPTLFTYSLLVSGADLLLLAYLAFIFDKLRRGIPILLLLGISFFSILLLGPIADLRNPDRASLIFTHGKLFSTEENPGISLITIQGSVMWPLAFILSLIFILLYFSYPMHKKYLATRKFTYKVLSLGVTSEEKYKSLRKPMKVLACVALIPVLSWTVYPGTLLAFQTSRFLWDSMSLLPLIYFADTFIVSTGVALLTAWVIRNGKLDNEFVKPFLTIHGVAAISLALMLGLQTIAWFIKYGSSIYEVAFKSVSLWINVTILLLSLVFLLSLLGHKVIRLTPIVAIAGLTGAITSKWNIFVNAQLVSPSGTFVASLPSTLTLHELPMMISIIAAGVSLFTILTFIFPVVRNEW